MLREGTGTGHSPDSCLSHRVWSPERIVPSWGCGGTASLWVRQGLWEGVAPLPRPGQCLGWVWAGGVAPRPWVLDFEAASAQTAWKAVGGSSRHLSGWGAHPHSPLPALRPLCLSQRDPYVGDRGATACRAWCGAGGSLLVTALSLHLKEGEKGPESLRGLPKVAQLGQELDRDPLGPGCLAVPTLGPIP